MTRVLRLNTFSQGSALLAAQPVAPPIVMSVPPLRTQPFNASTPGFPSALSDPLGRITTFLRDAYNNATTMIYAEGASVEMIYGYAGSAFDTSGEDWDNAAPANVAISPGNGLPVGIVRPMALFAGGEYIFREGEVGNRLYLIVEGEVRISRDVPGSGEEALAILKPGAMFGEMAVFDRSERSTDAISNGGTKVITIARSDFELLLDFNREVAHKVLWAMVRMLSARLRSTNDSLRTFLAMSMF
mgnify:CR=1 FL=1